MPAYYVKVIDKMISPKTERKFHLGRRGDTDRRLVHEDRRLHAGDDFIGNQSERRNLEKDRRTDDLHERRRRWFRTSKWQSRHF